MKLDLSYKAFFKRTHLLSVLAFLIIVLFLYAAFSKLLDFQTFQVQLGLSPLLTTFAEVLAVFVPALEIAIALLLMVPRFRKSGFLFSFCLMTMFTAYIFLVLHFADHVPCSCGGILESMSWNEHLIFNMVYMILCGAGYELSGSDHDNEASSGNWAVNILQEIKLRVPPKAHLLTAALSGIFLVVLLFLVSENQIHHHNNFTRRFAGQPLTKTVQKDLGLNSYYIAGTGGDEIYLGNYSSPLHLLRLDPELLHFDTLSIKLEQDSLPVLSPQLKVHPPYFYLIDGQVPYIFRGSLDTGLAIPVLGDQPFYFSYLEPMAKDLVAIQTRSAKTNKTVLGSIELNGSPKLHLSPGLLQAQGEGIFEAHGELLYNWQLQQIVYIHRYHNEIVFATPDLRLRSREKTIDTIQASQLEVVHLKNSRQFSLSSPAMDVNARSATYGNYLFVHSKVAGRYESEKLWAANNVIDVYRIPDFSYRFSFYIPKIGDTYLSDFRVENHQLVALTGSILACYVLNPGHFDNNDIQPGSSLKPIKNLLQ